MAKATALHVGISVIGEQQDAFTTKRPERRWARFRPSVAFSVQEEIPFERVYLIYQPKRPNQEEYFQQARADIESILAERPKRRIEVLPTHLQVTNPYDLNCCFSALSQVVASVVQSEPEAHLHINMNTGTHTMQMAFYLIALRTSNPVFLHQVQPGDTKGADPIRANTIGSRLGAVQISPRTDADDRERELVSALLVVETAHPEIRQEMGRLAQIGAESDEPILLIGATGTGKTKAAAEIHRLWTCRSGLGQAAPFKSCNCAAFGGDTNMTKSELFGHVKNAFTGATEPRMGVLEYADHGTLFLDEIGELPLEVQPLLLTALDTGCFSRTGEMKERHSRFRLICATNRNLEEEVMKGRFREDLYARIRTWEFRLSPLSERRQDIPKFLEYYLNKWNERNMRPSNSSGFVQVAYCADAWEQLTNFAIDPATPWRGNLRDVYQATERMATLAKMEGHAGRCQITAPIVDWAINKLKMQWGLHLSPAVQGKPSAFSVADLIEWASHHPHPGSLIDKCEMEIQDAVLALGKSKAEAGRILYEQPNKGLANPSAHFTRRQKLLREQS